MEPSGAFKDGHAGKPLGERVRRKMDEDALAELLDRRQPVGVLTEGRAFDGEADVFEFIARERRRLEAREPVDAGDLA